MMLYMSNDLTEVFDAVFCQVEGIGKTCRLVHLHITLRHAI